MNYFIALSFLFLDTAVLAASKQGYFSDGKYYGLNKKSSFKTEEKKSARSSADSTRSSHKNYFDTTQNNFSNNENKATYTQGEAKKALPNNSMPAGDQSKKLKIALLNDFTDLKLNEKNLGFDGIKAYEEINSKHEEKIWHLFVNYKKRDQFTQDISPEIINKAIRLLEKNHAKKVIIIALLFLL
jgi:hypothetical protein